MPSRACATGTRTASSSGRGRRDGPRHAHGRRADSRVLGHEQQLSSSLSSTGAPRRGRGCRRRGRDRRRGRNVRRRRRLAGAGTRADPARAGLSGGGSSDALRRCAPPAPTRRPRPRATRWTAPAACWRCRSGLLPVADARAPLRALVASLAPGGAERIVLEWLGSGARARARRRARRAAPAPPRARPAARTCRVASAAREIAGGFPRRARARLARRGAGFHAPGSRRRVLALLCAWGVRTVPVVHNARDGWRNDPASWDPRHVPLAVACAEAVRAEMLAAGCRVPVVAIRHRPRVGAAGVRSARAPRGPRGARHRPPHVPRGSPSARIKAAEGPRARRRGPRARWRARRDAALVILGGMLERPAFASSSALLDAALAHRRRCRLRLPGWVASIEPYLAACDALLNVSRFEGLSIAAQEALAAGLPVVATDVGGQGEIGASRARSCSRPARRRRRSPRASRSCPCAPPSRPGPRRARRAPGRSRSLARPLRPAVRHALRDREPERRRRAALAGEPLQRRSREGQARSPSPCAATARSGAFAQRLRAAGVDCFRAMPATATTSRSPSRVLAHAARAAHACCASGTPRPA